MTNEILLILSLVFLYGGVLLMYRMFGKTGLYCSTVIATITANIEVLLMIEAFGMEQTLGNVLFATTFLVTDILSENVGRKEAQRSVYLGVATAAAFILISQSWLLYHPAASDWARPGFETIFANTPRLMIVSFVVYAVSQSFDVWIYHKWWSFTNRRCGDSTRFLWLRNNGSTLLSQIINTVLYTFGAFWGMYDMETLLHICISSYVIYIVTSLADTPALYLSRKVAAANRAAGRD